MELFGLIIAGVVNIILFVLGAGLTFCVFAAIAILVWNGITGLAGDDDYLESNSDGTNDEEHW